MTISIVDMPYVVVALLHALVGRSGWLIETSCPDIGTGIDTAAII